MQIVNNVSMKLPFQVPISRIKIIPRNRKIMTSEILDSVLIKYLIVILDLNDILCRA